MNVNYTHKVSSELSGLNHLGNSGSLNRSQVLTTYTATNDGGASTATNTTEASDHGVNQKANLVSSQA